MATRRDAGKGKERERKEGGDLGSSNRGVVTSDDGAGRSSTRSSAEEGEEKAKEGSWPRGKEEAAVTASTLSY